MSTDFKGEGEGLGKGYPSFEFPESRKTGSAAVFFEILLNLESRHAT